MNDLNFIDKLTIVIIFLGVVGVFLYCAISTLLTIY